LGIFLLRFVGSFEIRPLLCLETQIVKKFTLTYCAEEAGGPKNTFSWKLTKPLLIFVGKAKKQTINSP
jgi:hypothetical protein